MLIGTVILLLWGSLSQKNQWNICVHNDLYINLYLYIFLWATTSIYIELNMSSYWCMWLQSITTWSLLSPLLFITPYSPQWETWLPSSTIYFSIPVYHVQCYQKWLYQLEYSLYIQSFVFSLTDSIPFQLISYSNVFPHSLQLNGFIHLQYMEMALSHSAFSP